MEIWELLLILVKLGFMYSEPDQVYFNQRDAHFRVIRNCGLDIIYFVFEPSVYNLDSLPFKRLGHKGFPFDNI